MKNGKKILAVLLIALLIIPSGLAFASSKGNLFKNKVINKSDKTQLQNTFKENVRNEKKIQSTATETTFPAFKKAQKKFIATGILVDFEKEFVVVKIEKATKNGKTLIGQDVTFSLTPKTKISGRKNLALFEFGMVSVLKVVVSAYEKEGTLYASRVLFKEPRKVILNGQVVSVNSSSFVMNVKTGNKAGEKFIGSEVEVNFFEKTKFSYPSTLTVSLKPGLYVNVVGYEKEGKINAVRVVVKAKQPLVGQNTTETTTSEPGNPTETTLTSGESTPAADSETTSSPLQVDFLKTLKVSFSEFIKWLKGMFSWLF